MSEIDETTKQHLPVGQVIGDLRKERDDLNRAWHAALDDLKRAKDQLQARNRLLDDLQGQYNDQSNRLQRIVETARQFDVIGTRVEHWHSKGNIEPMWYEDFTKAVDDLRTQLTQQGESE